MHTVICAECGAETQVPFLPKNDRPVYCSTCYDKVRVARDDLVQHLNAEFDHELLEEAKAVGVGPAGPPVDAE